MRDHLIKLCLKLIALRSCKIHWFQETANWYKLQRKCLSDFNTQSTGRDPKTIVISMLILQTYANPIIMKISSKFAPFDSWSPRCPGPASLPAQVNSTLGISLMCCSFFVPRGITVHMHFNLKVLYTWIYSPDLGDRSWTTSPYVSSGPNVSVQTRKLELKFS